MAAMPTAEERRDRLKAVWQEARGCVKCPELAAARQTVVFGAGNADADLMFVGEAPGRTEDERGLPFVGAAGRLLEQLLAEIGLERSDVFIANVLKCRPPGNRDPHPVEIENCQGYLMRQVDLIEPRVICTLGNFATKLLRADPAGITRVHGQPEVRVIGHRAVRLYPIFHPAAALYTPANVATLREDFLRLPELLALEPPEQPPGAAAEAAAEREGPSAAVEPAAEREPTGAAAEAATEREPTGTAVDPAAEREGPRALPEPEGVPATAPDQLGLF
jgi:DNA polymerase